LAGGFRVEDDTERAQTVGQRLDRARAVDALRVGDGDCDRGVVDEADAAERHRVEAVVEGVVGGDLRRGELILEEGAVRVLLEVAPVVGDVEAGVEVEVGVDVPGALRRAD
jgi:hypothetical protein